jgi:predicted flap endonuclease-1-like 5' DNA nuclease
MMTSLTLPANDHHAHKPCRCGCQGTEAHCCRLDCVRRPRFFCGQLLTDQDLTSLVEWTDRRLRLSRYRHGWGVVCGLDIRCDPKHHGMLTLMPGYAIGCCGEDIVVCKESPIDLSVWCKPPVDPCAELRRQQPGYVPYVEVGCVRMPVGELRILDLSIRYDEKLTDAQTALGRGLCHRDAECEYTRVEESYRVTIEEGIAGADPHKTAAEKWLEEYRTCARIIADYTSRFPGYTRSEQDFHDVRIWLLKWLETHPLHEFCFVRDCICDAASPPDEREILRWLYWIVQDCRNAFASCDCHACLSPGAVPLARVWLRVSGTRCTVLRVDPHPPYRRHLSRDCWPAPHGYVNASRWLWRRREDVCLEAAALGINIARVEEIKWPSTFGEMRDLFDASPYVECGDDAVAQVLTTDALGPRIVAVRGRRRPYAAAPAAGGANPQPQGADDLTELPNVGRVRADDFEAKGITTFAQIGAMSRDELRTYLPKLADGPLDEVIARANELAQQKANG